MFYSIDGGDGVGKSTQIGLFCEWLRERGQEVVTCRDPGSTRLGEAVRELLLNRHDLEIHRRSEMLLYMAARAQMVEEVIRPALDAGKTVVCDRFLLANVVVSRLRRRVGYRNALASRRNRRRRTDARLDHRARHAGRSRPPAASSGNSTAWKSRARSFTPGCAKAF